MRSFISKETIAPTTTRSEFSSYRKRPATACNIGENRSRCVVRRRRNHAAAINDEARAIEGVGFRERSERGRAHLPLSLREPRIRRRTRERRRARTRGEEERLASGEGHARAHEREAVGVEQLPVMTNGFPRPTGVLLRIEMRRFRSARTPML